MCDPGMDGDMHDPNTASGKPVGAQPVWKDGRLQYETPRGVFGQLPRRPADRSLWGRCRRALRVLWGSEQ